MADTTRTSAAPRERLADVLDQATLYVVALLVLSVPLFLLTTISEYGYGKSMVALVGISALSILWAAASWARGTWSVRWPWITFPFLAFVAASLLSLTRAINGRVVVQSLVLVVFFFQLLVVVANVVRDRKHVQLLLSCLLTAGFVAAVYGLLQYIGVARGPYGGTGLSETISTFGNRNYLGGFLAYLLFPSVILVLRPRWRWVRLIAAIFIAFCFGMALLVQQTAIVVALVAAAVALVVGGFIFRPASPLRKNKVWVVLLLVLLLLASLVEAPSGPLNSVVGLSADESSWIGKLWSNYGDRARSWDWWVGWEMFTDSPLVGVGLGNYKLNFLAYKAEFLSSPRAASYDFYIARAAQAHNDYVQALAETGILGGLAVLSFLGVLAASLWRGLRSTRDGEARLELLLIACGIVPVLVHALVSFPAHLPSSSLVFVVLIGIAHSRAYGSSAAKTTLSGWPLKTAAVALTAAGLVVSGFAVADLSANTLMYAGKLQLQRGNTYAAEALLAASLRYDFAPRQTYYELASAQLRLGQYDEAWGNLERCMTRFLDEGVYLTYANLAAQRGELDKAQAAVDLLLRGRPKALVEQQARYIEAVIAIRAREYDRATQLLESLTQDHPSYETGFIALGDLYASQDLVNLARKNLQRALYIIDNKLRRAQAKLDSGEIVTVAEYGEVRGTIESLTRQRDIVVERLDTLPSSL